MATKITSIVFDFDGTLADSLGRSLDSYHYALAQVGAKMKTDADVRKYFGTGADRIIQQLVQDPAKAEEAFEHYLSSNRGKPSDAKWHEGVLQLLENIKREKVPTAIVTGRHSRDLEIVAQSMSLAEHFGIQICDDHLQNSKPHPEGIILAATKLGIKPSEVMYVGDSLGDLEASKAAGAVAIAALWDHTADRAKLAAHADYSAKTADEIWPIFLELRNR